LLRSRTVIATRGSPSFPANDFVESISIFLADFLTRHFLVRGDRHLLSLLLVARLGRALWLGFAGSEIPYDIVPVQPGKKSQNPDDDGRQYEKKNAFQPSSFPSFPFGHFIE
jgi:hypothetical protein